MPTPTIKIEDVEGGALPTGVLMFGKGKKDKDLISFALALEAALKST